MNESDRKEMWAKLDSKGIRMYLKHIDVNEKISVSVFNKWPTLKDTHFHDAVKYSKDTLLATKILLKKGADPTAINSYGDSVLDCAILNSECNVDTIVLLLKRGARLYIKKISLVTHINSGRCSRPEKDRIFLSRLLIQFMVVDKYILDLNFYYVVKILTDDDRCKILISIRDDCIRDLKSLEKYNIFNVLYRFCIYEITAFDENDNVALFDAYVKKKCPHFDELLKLALETSCRWNHLLSLVDFQNTSFADRLNWDCILRIISILDPADKLNFLSAYWKCR
jgi:hypothetical protein